MEPGRRRRSRKPIEKAWVDRPARLDWTPRCPLARLKKGRLEATLNRNRTSTTVLVCCLAIEMPMTAIAADIVGTVARVMDGNTFEIALSKDSIISIRLCGVHSPERSEPNYRPARRLLSEKIEKREIRCVRVGEGTVCDNRSKPTNKGKIIAQCFIGDDDVATIMIRARMACDWPKFSGGHYQKVGVSDVCIQSK